MSKRKSEVFPNGIPNGRNQNGNTSKRQRTDSAAPGTGNGATQKRLTSAEEKGIAKWIDSEYAKGNEKPFTTTIAKTTTRNADQEESLTLNDREYGKAVCLVSPLARWNRLTKFKRCTVGEKTFSVGDCVYIKKDDGAGDVDDTDQWKVQIREVRAVNENYVYVRVAWFYTRDDIKEQKKLQPHHGRYELFPSDLIDIQDAKTINGIAKVRHWDHGEDDNKEVLEDGSSEDEIVVQPETEFFWRQSYVAAAKEFRGECVRMCKCNTPENPDKKIVNCPHCRHWLHAECLVEGALEAYLTDGHSKLNGTTKAKKRRDPDEEDAIDPAYPAEKDGVKAELVETAVAGKEKETRVSIRLTDRRKARVSVNEREACCLLCEKIIDPIPS